MAALRASTLSIFWCASCVCPEQFKSSAACLAPKETHECLKHPRKADSVISKCRKVCARLSGECLEAAWMPAAGVGPMDAHGYHPQPVVCAQSLDRIWRGARFSPNTVILSMVFRYIPKRPASPFCLPRLSHHTAVLQNPILHQFSDERGSD